MRKSALLERESSQAQSTEAVAALREKHVLPLPGPMYSKPLQIVRGRGQFLYDEKGKKYLDGFAGVATVSIGHSHPHWLKKIKEQMDEYFHTTALYLHPSLGLLAQRLVTMLKMANPQLEMCFFTNSGSEANELAALIAKNYTGSHEFVALQHSYHGRTLMAMALTGQSNWRHSTPYGQSVSFAKSNYTYRGYGYKECLDDLAQTVRTSTSGRIAAFFAEPINGVGGVVTPEPEYFPGAYELVKKAGGLFISDEVQTGVYRTGHEFLGIQKWGVKPDIVTMAKGLGNGYPVGCVVTTREIAEAMKGKLHYNTFGGSPVQMAAVGAVLDVLEKEELAKNAHEVGAHLIGKLKKIGDKNPFVGEVRGAGLMIGVELVKDKKSQEPASDIAVKLLDLTKERGLLIGKGGLSGNILRIKPPLCITRKDADFAADAIEDSLGKV
ncbi:MAG: aspartate aminotransferase family protein [Elusimicrobia bacterium]|nr:aspartate aminotransferase family protein [Elusimicrobiota bacterium]